VIFYAIYKIQQICVTIGVTFLQIRPWKELDVCNVAHGLPAGAGCSIPVSSPALAAGGRLGRGLRGTRGGMAPVLGGRLGRRTSSAAAAGGRCCAPGSDATGVWPRKSVVRLATGEAKGATRLVARLR
jgi:hypothetical protein